MPSPARTRIGSSSRAWRNGITPERLAAGACGILFAYAVGTVIAIARGWWFVDPMGRPVPIDFIDVWAAGRMAVEGNPAGIYDWNVHKAMEETAAGYPFAGYFGWHYPPTFLLAATPLALAGYLPAWFIWIALSGGFFAWSIYRVFKFPPLVPILLASPAAAWCAVVGQNGFLTAGLIAGTLACLERRPAVAGLFLGLLTYKPQFGLLFPVALLAGCKWTVLISAAITAVVFAGVSLLIFGAGTWVAFFHSMSTTVNDVLRTGGSAWPKIQSVYAAIHQLGDNDRLAWIGQGGWTLLFAALIAVLWARPGVYNVKAALLATGSIAASPYAYVYDTVILLVPVAFLARDGATRGWLAYDKALLTLSVMLPLFFTVIGSLTTPLASLLLVIVCARRIELSLEGRNRCG